MQHANSNETRVSFTAHSIMRPAVGLYRSDLRETQKGPAFRRASFSGEFNEQEGAIFGRGDV